MRALLVLLAALLLLTGCTRPVMRQFPLAGEQVPAGLESLMLCGYAQDAVRKIVAELIQAPNEDAALIRQTVLSYQRYADRLRELAEMTSSQDTRELIIDAAVAADAYAAEVDTRDDYRVDIQPVISTSEAAFPSCALPG